MTQNQNPERPRLGFTLADVREQCALLGDAPLAHPLPAKDILALCDALEATDRALLDAIARLAAARDAVGEDCDCEPPDAYCWMCRVRDAL